MKIISRIPIHIDYVLGLLMIITSVYQIYKLHSFFDMSAEVIRSMAMYVLPSWVLFFCGIILLILPNKNLRRTIWLCSIMMAVDLIAMGYTEYDDYSLISGYIHPFIGTPLYTYSVEYLTFSILHFGCGIAMMINATFFAIKRVRSIYAIIIAIVLVLVVDYFIIKAEQDFYMDSIAFMQNVLQVYVSHMVLFGIFILVFTSGEVSWYTAKGDMVRAMTRLRTINATFGIYTIKRNQFIILDQLRDSEYTLRLRQGKSLCNMEVRHHGDRMDIIFSRSGTASMAGALYLQNAKYFLPDTISNSPYVDIYGEEGVHIRMKIVDPRKRFIARKVAKARLSRGLLPNFKFTVTNGFLYHLWQDNAWSDLAGKGKKYDIDQLVLGYTKGKRTVYVLRGNGTVFYSMNVVAMVPVREYGAYTKLFIYGDMGEYIALKVARPRKNQAEKPDAAEA